MAKMTAQFGFIGTLNNLVAYQLPGVEGTVIRTKAANQSNRVKKGDEFENTRRNNAEFGGKARGARFLKQALNAHWKIADQNLNSAFIRLLRDLPKRDLVHHWGERDLLFTAEPELLEGFNLNRKMPFDAVLRSPVHGTVSKETSSAEVTIPAITRHNFHAPGFSFYRLTAQFSLLPDLLAANGYKAHRNEYQFPTTKNDSDWYSVTKGSHSLHWELQLAPVTIPDSYVLILSVGIQFGKATEPGEIDIIDHVGAAKVLRCC